MIEIRPFKTYRYNSLKVKNLSRVVTPPYDVITKEEQVMFYNLSRYNFIRLILGKRYPSDTKGSNCYTRARDFFKRWVKEGVLIKEKEDAIYVYEQRYRIDGALKRRIGFIALMRLKDFSSNLVFPHEKTFDEPKRDRFALLKTVKANLSPIFNLFNDPGDKITTLLKNYTKNHKGILEITDRDLVIHKLWQIKNRDVIKEIVESMRNKDIYIADGHHRYEAALEYKRLMQRRDSKYLEEAPYNYIMVYFLDLNEDAVTILPTHRVIWLKEDFKKEGMQQLLRKFFFLKRKKNLDVLITTLKCHRKKPYFFGLCQGAEDCFLLVPKTKAIFKKFMREIDVEILHELIIDKILRKDIIREISYTRDLNYIKHLIKNDRNFIAFLLNPTRLSQFKNAIREKIRLPHKSTYFYPKPLSGLVIHKF